MIEYGTLCSEKEKLVMDKYIAGLNIMLFGLTGVFTALILFYLVIKAMVFSVIRISK